MDIDGLKEHRRIGIDTMVFVYLIERPQAHLHRRALELFDLLYDRNVTPVCSTVLITELIQHPLRAGNTEVAGSYQQILFHESTIVFVPITVPVAFRAAQLAAKYNLKTPDALHLSCAIEGKATAFVTADKRIKDMSEIQAVHFD